MVNTKIIAIKHTLDRLRAEAQYQRTLLHPLLTVVEQGKYAEGIEYAVKQLDAICNE